LRGGEPPQFAVDERQGVGSSLVITRRANIEEGGLAGHAPD
jgi:hypothetical protein